MEVIRFAETKDVHQVVKLIYLAIKDIAYQLTGETTYELAIAQLERFYLEEGNRFSRQLIQVKEVDNNVVGMILCYDGQAASQLYAPIWHHLKQKQIKEATIDNEADDDEYYIDALAVDPLHQGRGIAKQLFAAAEHYARIHQFGKIALNVDVTNEKALALYERLGYKKTKQIPINKRPYWHMVKPLQQ